MTELIVRELRLRAFSKEAIESLPQRPTSATVSAIAAQDAAPPGPALATRQARRRGTHDDRAL